MKKEKSQKVLLSGIAMVVLFILWTVAISLIDVQPIGPQNSSVGFATLNGFIHSLTGVHMAIYTVTDWLGLIPLCFILGFALLGLIQLIKRKSLFKVDSSILVLGAFYIVVMAAYLFFEFYVVNYRPVLINGFLEASYPSSTTRFTARRSKGLSVWMTVRFAARSVPSARKGILSAAETWATTMPKLRRRSIPQSTG